MSADGPSQPQRGPGPDFGPSGYLPERAARRARKIVLRAPLGLSWVVASLLAGVVVAVASGAFLLRTAAPPGAPWIAVGAVADLGPDARPSATGLPADLLVVTAGGRVRAFVAPAGVRWCAASNLLEEADGHAWTVTGRGLDGAPSLDEHPTLVHDGVVHVDPTVRLDGPPPDPRPRPRGCT